MTKLWLLPMFLLLAACSSTPSADGAKLRCPVCGMFFEKGARTSFGASHEGKRVPFCSFTCARRFRHEHPGASLTAHDFESREELNANEAYYLVKSRNVLKELPFDMPPSVVAFKSEADAKKTQSRLGDGQVVKSFGGVEKAHE